ncbi:MAG: formylmethanofuran dehydrogenase subunit C [Methanomicrobiales archaeon]|nr:formylmethanofuran dehydrogenase subunit C [Methanomicrobiales archaeon]
MRVVLAVKERKKPFLPIEAEAILPSAFLDQEAKLTVWKGNKELPFAEVFAVSIDGEAESADDVEIVIRGDSSRIKRIGEYMDGGRIVIEGDIGMHCGNFMEAGTIEIMGSADAWLGREMRGGSIICRGNAGDYCGSGYRGEKKGMRGGSIEVFGNAGDFTAEMLAGGSIVIHGNAGDMAGVDMHDGALVIHGDARMVCANMTGGTCTVHGTVADMMPTFVRTGQVLIEGTEFTRFSGDIANRGKGTLFIRRWQYMD